jgi:anti-anti-sigma factor
VSPLADVLTETRDGVPVARLQGQVDMSNAAAVGDQLVGSVTSAGFGLVVDLSETTYLDSAGVNLLFDLAERLETRQQVLRLVVPEGAVVRRLLRIVGVESAAGVDATLDAAVAAVVEHSRDVPDAPA